MPPSTETKHNELVERVRSRGDFLDSWFLSKATEVIVDRFAPLTRLVVFILQLTIVAPCCADLTPQEVAVVAASGNRESEGLAKYYLRMRGIPAEHLCMVVMPQEEVCPRPVWEAKIRPAIRQWLAEHDPQRKLKCLVTVWGVPLKISPAAPTASSIRYVNFLAAERDHRQQLLAEVVTAFDRLAPSGDAGKTPATTAPTSNSDQRAADERTKNSATGDAAAPTDPKTESGFAELQKRLEAALQRAQQRVAALPEGDERLRLQTQVQQLATAAGGINVLLPALNQRLTTGDANKEQIKSEFDVLRGRLMAQLDDRAVLEQMPLSMERDALILAIIERAQGLLGSVQWLDQELQTAKRNETGASFDSELSLVLWQDDYQLLRWQPNYLRPGYANSQLPVFFPTLMVARIDAPTLRLAKGLIDTAIEVEQKGLRGNVYIDARGLAKVEQAPPAVGSYEDYDHSLLVTARGIESQTDLKVVLENTPKLFQAGECPHAALYCGWYSLAKYVDAFDWVPGAVAYHLASAEAATLRDPKSEVWCKKMLEDGVCATIGPVYEPYLAAFPRPDEFFAVLLRGDRTLVECYYLTQPFNSWMMTLIGDPLYRPFKYRAAVASGASSPPSAAPTKPAAPPAPAVTNPQPASK